MIGSHTNRHKERVTTDGQADRQACKQIKSWISKLSYMVLYRLNYVYYYSGASLHLSICASNVTHKENLHYITSGCYDICDPTWENRAYVHMKFHHVLDF